MMVVVHAMMAISSSINSVSPKMLTVYNTRLIPKTGYFVLNVLTASSFSKELANLQ